VTTLNTTNGATAQAIPSNEVMNEDQHWRAVKAHIAKGDQAKDKAEQHYIAASQHLKVLRAASPDQETFLNNAREKVGLGKSRAYEILQIADGRPLAGIRAEKAERERRRHVRHGGQENAPRPEVDEAPRARQLEIENEGLRSEVNELKEKLVERIAGVLEALDGVDLVEHTLRLVAMMSAAERRQLLIKLREVLPKPQAAEVAS
jgi:hypothetical protein